MNNVLLTIGALLVGILAALAAVPMVIDWNSYRGVFEEEASRMMNRDVRLGGAVAVRLLPTPYVRFEKLRIADTASSGGEPLFRADSVTMRLSVGALLKGELEARDVELKRPALRLAVDKSGEGNWRSLVVSQGSLPFLPAGVSLRAVHIKDGTLTLSSGAGTEARLNAIDGELAADSASGPFRFRGITSLSSEPGPGGLREVRVSAGTADEDGSIRLRASVRAPETGNVFGFDGRVRDLRERMRFDGEVTAKLPFGAASDARDRSSKTGPGGTGAGSPGRDYRGEEASAAYELRARLEGDVNGARLSDIAFALDDPADPQLVTGEAAASWGLQPRVEVTLASKSLNIDRFAAAGPAGDPLDTARAALNTALAALPADADTTARLKADRITLGGAPVTGVAIAMTRTGSRLELTSLRAELPGQTRVEANGIVSRDTRTLALSGPVTVRGAHLGRFLGWARGAKADSPATTPSRRYDGPFSLDGELAMTREAIELKAATAEFAGNPVRIDLRVTTEGRRRITLSLDARRLDLAEVWPAGIEIDEMRAALAGRPPPSDPARAGEVLGTRPVGSTGFFSFDTASTDLSLEVRASELKIGLARGAASVGALELQAAALAVSVDAGTVTITRGQAATATGLEVDIEGEITGLVGKPAVAGKGPAGTTARSGNLRWAVSAPSPAAVTEALDAVEWPEPLRPAAATVSALGRTRMAGATIIGARGPLSLDISFDGTVDGGRVYGTAQFETGLANWRRSRMSVATTVDSGNAGRWLEIAGLAVPASAGEAPRFGQRGTLVVHSEGRPDTGLTTYAALTTSDDSAAYEGIVAAPEQGSARLDGVLTVKARDAADALALAGIGGARGPLGAAVSGQVRVMHDAGTTRLQTAALSIGKAAVSGSLTIAPPQSAGGLRNVSGRLAADTASVPGLLAALSDRRAAAGAGENGSVWPQTPLVFSTLEGIAGRIELSARKLVIDGSLALDDVTAGIAIEPGKLTMHRLTGQAAGGTLSGSVALNRIPGGARLETTARFDRSKDPRGGDGATFPLSIEASASGQGISARGIVAALAGRGEVALGGGRIAGVAPSAVAAVADQFLESPEPRSGDEVATELRRSLASSFLDVRPRKLPLTLSDGIARISTPPLETDRGQARLDLTIDLGELKLSSEWRIEALAKPLPSARVKPRLPAVVIASAQSLSDPTDQAENLIVAAFEQELQLRRIERDADVLEQARKVAEEQRRKAEAEEAARIAAAAKAAEQQAAAEAAARAAAAAALPPGASGVPVRPGALPAEAPGPVTGNPPAGAPAGATPPPPPTLASPPQRAQRKRAADQPFFNPLQNP